MVLLWPLSQPPAFTKTLALCLLPCLSPAMYTVPLEADAVLYMLVFRIFSQVLSSLEI